MNTIDQVLSEKRELTIHTVASALRQAIAAQWQQVLHEQHAELDRIFAQAGEWAYGVYARALFRPLGEQLQRAGLRSSPHFPGEFESSIEHWGPPEERERCLWSVLQSAQGETLGTIVVRLFHDHTAFRLPYAPAVLALDQTDEQAIVAALSDPSMRRPPTETKGAVLAHTPATHPQAFWDYGVEVGLADCIAASRPEISEALLDLALARWGQYGWELVSVVPHRERLIAFFRRSRQEERLEVDAPACPGDVE